MKENRIQWANKPNSWSVSRRTLMNRCPRAWILKYGFAKKQGGFNRHLQNISDWSSPWRIMQRTLRGVVIDRLDAFSANRTWIENDVLSKIRNRIVGALLRQKAVLDVIETRSGKTSSLRKKISDKEIDRLAEICCKRYESIFIRSPFREILQGKITRWFTFSRLNKTKIDDYNLHISPDIVWYSGQTCHLLRFTVQGIANPGEDRRLENMSMVLWAMNQQSFPATAERYIVENLYWNRGRWNLRSERCNKRLVSDSKSMILNDLSAMSDLYNRLGPACDLSQIPLAKNKRHCLNCGHRDNCPGGEDLERASLIQSALEMAKSSVKRI